MEPDDELLIAAFLRGESVAVERIRGWVTESVRRFRPRLALPWEDVQQELLLEVTALLRRGAFRGESRLRTYLWRIAKYRCLNLLRDQAKQRRSDPEEEELERLPCPESSPRARLLERESSDGLVRLMAAMPPECRRLWTMILAGKSYREMGEELGVATGTLRVRVLRCRRKAVALWESWRDRSSRE